MNQTALASKDYDPVAVDLTFAENETSKTVEIRTHSDTTPELIEYFAVILENPPGGLAYIDPTAVRLL